MRQALLFLAIGLVAFLVSLDGFIINVAIPTISGELGVRSDVGTWLITVFSMSSTLFIPLSSWLALRFGRIRLFFVATLLFTLFSLLCGLADHFTLLLILRILQGAPVGILIPLTLNLMLASFPPEKRGIAIGFWSFFVMVSPAMGPMIGGWLSDNHWPWMFFLNVPIGLLCALTVLLLMWDQNEKKGATPLDTVGVLLLFIGVACLQSALNRGQLDDWFRSTRIITLFIISGISLTFFLTWELFSRAPFLNLKTFLRRNFTLAALMMGVAMGTIFSSFILDSLWVQRVLGYTPAWAGFSLTPVGLFPLLIYPIMGRIVGFLDKRIWLTLSFALYAITFYMLSRINLETTFAHLAITRLIQGLGFAMFTVPLSLLAIEGVGEEEMPFVISLYSFFRTLCVSLAIPLATTLWLHREAFYQTRIVTRHMPEQMLESMRSIALTNELIESQASTLGLADVYYLSAWIFVALLIPVACIKASSALNTETS